MRSFSLFLFVGLLASCQNWTGPQNLSPAGEDPTNTPVFGGQRVLSEDQLARSIVGLQFQGNSGQIETCTGVLLNGSVVLTAAHCIPQKIETLDVYFNTSLEETSVIPSEKKTKALRAIQHPLYQPTKAQIEKTKSWGLGNPYDLGILILKSESPGGSSLFHLPKRFYSVSQVPKAKVAGFGAEFFDARSGYREGLAELKVATIFRAESSQNEILVVDQTRGSGVCVSDSGGPLFLHSEGSYLILGVASQVVGKKGVSTCRGQSRFVSTFHNLSWILSFLKVDRTDLDQLN